MNNKERTNLIIIGAALIIIVLLGWLVVSRNRAPSSVLGNSTTTTSGTSATTTTTASSSDTLTVKDQKSGLNVDVESMTLSADSWVAVKDPNGWILGAGRFAPGTVSGSVPLLRGTLAGKTYTVVIYTDNGDKAFDFHTDTLVDGVSSTFVAQ